MAGCSGPSQEERFATARAVLVAHPQRSRRPDTTWAGFLTALAKLPLPVLRARAQGVRQRRGAPGGASVRGGGGGALGGGARPPERAPAQAPAPAARAPRPPASTP